MLWNLGFGLHRSALAGPRSSVHLIYSCFGGIEFLESAGSD